MTEQRILVEGETCWQRARAGRVALLVDGASYFSALATAIERAERSILMLGWDFHSRTRLRRDDSSDPEADELRLRLDAAVRARRGLHVNVLGWDFAPIYALEREALPLLRLDMRSHRRVRFRLDDRHPLGASHHQKIVVVDDALAFCGGLDVTACRWDTPEHAAEDARREDPGFGVYPPFHDVHMAVDGAAAGRLGEIARERWRLATGRRLQAVESSNDPWPPELGVDLEDVTVGISRTVPAAAGRDAEVREVEKLHVAALRAARRFIYLENQYLTSSTVAHVLAERLREADGPEVVLVLPARCSGWLEEATMGVLRARLLRRLREADTHDRLRVYHPRIPGVDDADLTLHSKVAVIDDRLLRIGSANLSNRSMGLDTECDLAIEAEEDDGVARAIAGFRARLLAEHLGCEPQDVEASLAREPSPIRAIEALRDGDRTLAPLTGEVPEWLDSAVPEAALVDPERPAAVEAMAQDLGWDTERHTEAWLRAGLGVAGLAALAAVWTWTPLREWTDPDRLDRLLGFLQESAWGPVVGAAAFALAGLAMVPVTALTVAAALIFGWATGFATALLGALAGGSAGYLLGRILWRDAVRRTAGRRLDRLNQALGRRGLLAVATVRLLPVAPFTVVNLVAGASRIGFRDFALGTLVAMTPGTLLLTLATDRAAAAWREPDLVHVGLAGLLAVLLVAVTVALRRRLAD
ncbi:MAG: VTT domain-containing protein [Myxococcota bacterium]